MNLLIATQLFIETLLANGPAPAHASRMNLYAPLIGSWDVEVVDVGAEGSRRTSTGEWHFAWVLEGRAIQDVFVVPRRDARHHEQGTQGNRYGTTLRIYDPAADAWRVTWFNPVTGATNALVGRRVGEEIVQEGNDADGSRIRWIFSNITADSFRWRGETSTDAGRTWRGVVEFVARRAAGG